MGHPIVAAIIAASGIVLCAYGMWMRMEHRAHAERLQHFIGQHAGGGAAFVEEAVAADWRESLARRMNRYFAQRDYVQSTRLDLVRAGFSIKPTQLFLVRLVLALAGALTGSALLVSAGSFVRLIGMAAGFVIGYLAVRPYVGYRQRKRMDEFEKHLADGLDIMVGGLESGASLNASVELVSREMPAPLSTEFARVLRDASLGMSYEEAFSAMYRRVPSDDVGMLVSAIGVQLRVGGNLARVLRTLSETVRDRQRIRGDVKTLTAQQKMTGWLITAVPIVMVGALLVINHQYMVQIFHPGVQRYVALAGFAMIVVGNIVVRRILRIEV